MTPVTRPIALTIAGSDSGGGAGIQADLKTFHAYGVYGTSAITAVTAQNTRGVRNVQAIEPAVVRDQIDAVAEDLRPHALKTGMLANAAIVEAVADALARHGLRPYVLDPVMVAKSGHPLLDPDAVDALRARLLPLATLVTPNLPEAARLAGLELRGPDDARRAADRILEMGPGAVLVKGGHGEGPEVVDLYVDGAGIREWRRPRLHTRHTHGTGCTLSAAVAAALALGCTLPDAVDSAIDFTRRAMERAPGLGAGHGPLDHWVEPRTRR